MSENRQIIKNPLLVTDLFPKGIYYFGEGQGVSTAQSQLSVNEVEAEKSTVTMPVDEAQKRSESNPVAVVNELQENDENMIALTIINLFFDQSDADWDETTRISYDKLMGAVKVNQESVIPEDIEPLVFTGETEYSPALLGDRLAPVIFVWSDRAVTNIPEMFKARPTEKGIVIRFPSFATMCGNVEMKKHVWQTMKQVLKF
ncbi:MAG: hypothetical protein ACK5CZ_05665 [Bacteroidota bacterium]